MTRKFEFEISAENRKCQMYVNSSITFDSDDTDDSMANVNKRFMCVHNANFI
jgi:hypothetical protein